jgi:hypothetical protein
MPEPTELPNREQDPTLQEKMHLLWRVDRKEFAREAENLQLQGADVEDIEEAYALLINGEDIRLAHNFLVGGSEFAWLVTQFNTTARVSSEHAVHDKTRSTLLEIIASGLEVHLEMDWDPNLFMEEQYNKSANIGLGEVICLCGGTTDAYATTCREYVEEIWGAVGTATLAAIDAATRESGRQKIGKCTLESNTQTMLAYIIDEIRRKPPGEHTRSGI